MNQHDRFDRMLTAGTDDARSPPHPPYLDEVLARTRRTRQLADIQRHARKRHQTTAAWVRDALREARDTADRPGVTRKLAAIERAYQHAHPVGDIDQMLEEIERGYLYPLPE